MRKYWMMIAVFLLVLAGCSGGHEGHNSELANELPKEVKVEVKTVPEAVKAHEHTEIQAIVTQDGKAVNDADDVKFEIWKAGAEQHEMLAAKAKGNGVYTIDKTFPEDGVYHITAHTNARDMHVMPTVQITVGTGQAAAQEQEGQDHHHSDTTIQLTTDQVHAGKASPVQAQVQHSGEPLTGAEVQFEIWKDGAERHEYVSSKEGANGQYEASFVFEADTYHINVHVRKGELHEHKEQTVEVK